MSPTRRLFGFVLRVGVGMGLGAGMALAGGCATTTAPAEREKARVAALVVTNATPHHWRVTFREAQGTGAVVIRVAPRAVEEVGFARGGEFYVEQAVERVGANPLPSRSFSARLVVGQRYHWTLATLLTTSGTERIGL